jgi:Zn-dependent protease
MPETTAAVDRAAADIRLTPSARDVLERAVADASRRGEPDATSVDVLRALLQSPGSLAADAMRVLGVDPAALAARIPQDGAASTPQLRQLVVNANREAQVLGHYQVDSIHLLLALLYSDARPTGALLQSAGLTLYDVRRHLQTGAGKVSQSDAARPARAPDRTPDRALRRRPWPALRPVLGVSPIFIGLVLIVITSGALLWFDLLPAGVTVLTLAFVVAGWVVSVCVHEFFHAVMAYLGGDRDVAASGYLTLNPLRYTNIVMSIVFPVVALLLGGIGLPGGAVYINSAAIRTRSWESLVSLAGPVANALFAVSIGGLFTLALHLDWITVANLPFFEALGFLGFIEVFAVVLNLLPIPPLDGYGILRPWLPWSVRSAAAGIGLAGYMVVFLVLFYVPPVSAVFFNLVSTITASLGIDPFFVALGEQHMRFR